MPKDLGYDSSDPQSILSFAERLMGRKLGETIPSTRSVTGDPTHRKGAAGRHFEGYFGLPTDNDRQPDFKECGVELKSVPLFRGSRGQLRVKERTIISMMDYFAVAKEEWDKAYVRKKLNHILFVFFETDPQTPVADWVTKEVFLWSPSDSDNEVFEVDYDGIRRKVLLGKAEELSEGDSEYLAAARKGAGKGKDLVDQPFGPKAPSRAFSFKQCFTRFILEQRKGGFESLSKKLGVSKLSEFEAAVLSRYEDYKGKSVGELALRFGVSLKPKNSAATVVRRCLGVESNKTKIEEFEKAGVQIKTVRLNEKGNPREAMSFPAFNHMELIEQKWDESDLQNDTSRLFIVVLRGPERSDKSRDVLSEAFFWSPDEEQASIMRKEWEMFVSMIREGHADALPKASETKEVHVRPHALKGASKEPAPGGKTETKKGFWLNKGFVKRLIERHEAD